MSFSLYGPYLIVSNAKASKNTGDWWLSYWVSNSVNKQIPEGSGNVSHISGLLVHSTQPWRNLTTSEDNVVFYLEIYAVNRFSSDLYSVDDSLPFTLNIFLAQAFGILGTVVLTCYGLPWFAICLIPMTALYYKIQPPSLWPSLGVTVFDNVWLRYKDNLSPVLKGISFRTEPGEKIGIVGRTGAGKSSLFLSLFRLVEIYEGCITVDGVNLKYLDLHEIRSKLAVIPQDPFLFSGTVRKNLDPRNSHSDDSLWSAIDRCHLRECIDQMGGLEAVITQNGREFSVGQRQLLCLARAILTQAKVLCIDEATAQC
ncbi:Multidrug resistance-associated protein 5 [Bulinus truncatus]|nr:Multidrug resistance-associated protein 5 [Bulinus truncatus]